MWNYFYSHPVCWYKVLHLSQTSFGWAVEVKAELLRAVAAQLARWLARANINRARPGAMWQLHHHRLPATSWGFLPPTPESCSLQRIPEEKAKLRFRKSRRTASRGGRIFVLTFFPQFSNVFFQFSNVFPQFSCTSDLLFSATPAGKADEKLFVFTEVWLDRECEVLLELLNSGSCWWEQPWRCTGIFICSIFPKKSCSNSQSLAEHAFCFCRGFTNK